MGQAPPPPERRPLVVAHVSDLHLGAHDEDAVCTLPADVAAVHPALTVVTGDLTMRARPSEFRRVRELLDRLPEPRLVVLGNHDVPLVSVRRLVSPYGRYRAWVADEVNPVVRLPGLTALGLASMPRWRWKSGRVSTGQAEAVRDVLGGASPGSVRLLALHHPPFATGLARLAGRDRLTRAIVTSDVDLVLAGHTHRPTSGARWLTAGDRTHRVVEVVAGTATSRRIRGVCRSWTVVRFEPHQVRVEERHHRAGIWRTGRMCLHTWDG